ncbi:trihelix transcription factor ENAP2-like isoform X2 [Bidens hawaiensis]|uniref:trihelix transcription factor ENAP2-like isoform X2 n=1 Tax=Bidens hawaiensis TaxID=980011 RepID=UPI00404A66F5
MSGQSPTTHPSSDGNSTTSHQSETKLKKPKPKPPPVRDDCWSEAATFTLIESWGDKILKLNTGSLRQQHWQEVADAVNASHGHVKKARRTDVQCKNRIDTLKKKYKVEKGLLLQLGSDNYTSPWPFFSPLDSVIGSTFKPPAPPKTKNPATAPPKRTQKRKPISPPARTPLPPPPSSVPVDRRSKRPPPPPSNCRRNFSVMAAGDSDTSSSGGDRKRSRLPEKDDPYGQLAEAIGRFADVYAQVEESKQRQMVELEKQRMQFTKDLELERMKLLMESQVQLRKLKTGPDPEAMSPLA